MPQRFAVETKNFSGGEHIPHSVTANFASADCPDLLRETGIENKKFIKEDEIMAISGIGSNYNNVYGSTYATQKNEAAPAPSLARKRKKSQKSAEGKQRRQISLRSKKQGERIRFLRTLTRKCSVRLLRLRRNTESDKHG